MSTIGDSAAQMTWISTDSDSPNIEAELTFVFVNSGTLDSGVTYRISFPTTGAFIVATFDMKAYARRGAETRAAELQEELDAIYGAFPDLRRRAGRPVSTIASGESAIAASIQPAAPGKRKRKPMSAAQRKAVGARMKRYWAEKRKENR
jgi:hypothetical protein